MTPSVTTAELLAHARATIALPAEAAKTLTALHTAATDFFTQDEAVKRTHGSDDFTYGFRPYGRQYSVSPDRPDMNESFTYWADNPATVPHHDVPTVAPFLQALRDYWAVAAGITENVLTDLAAHYGQQTQAPVAFRDYSYLEINWYHPSDRDLLQDRHEDGHLLTLAVSDGPGLEIATDGQMSPVPVRDSQLLVMPGSLLTAMTGDDIPPLFHQVRNHRLPRRLTVLFLANPPLDRPVPPFVSREGRAVDIAQLARTSGAMFGLPPAPSRPAGQTSG
ncbi:2OG-Fe(II) oxygenase family protein [Streptomyces sp. NPDC051644]|uniref:2OG-Fe(II) oxygenase family protein n=1 Tax=Streptomyces sp. NPDC051644 TaxID=3365666 RepID=UPI0037967A74